VSGLVLDASVALAWMLPAEVYRDRAASVIEQVVQAGAVVPPLWFIEVGNAVVVSERRGRLPAPQVPILLRHLAALPIAVDAEMTANAWTDTLAVARTHGLSLYDATYLELARRLHLELATFDAQLERAARAERLELMQ
jgi:predicted nucleic acid-binding protein